MGLFEKYEKENLVELARYLLKMYIIKVNTLNDVDISEDMQLQSYNKWNNCLKDMPDVIEERLRKMLVNKVWDGNKV